MVSVYLSEKPSTTSVFINSNLNLISSLSCFFSLLRKNFFPPEKLKLKSEGFLGSNEIVFGFAKSEVLLKF